jgi:hypothetical protein
MRDYVSLSSIQYSGLFTYSGALAEGSWMGRERKWAFVGYELMPLHSRAQHFPSNLYPYTDHNHQQRPMLIHVHSCYSNCVRVLSLASIRSASWLAYSLHPRSLTPIWSWMHGCTKLMPTHAHPWTIISHPCSSMPTHVHPCPPMNNNIAPMPTQNPWAWVWAPNVGLCFIHNIEVPWSLLSEISHWSKRPRPSKFTLHYSITSLISYLRDPWL